MKDNTVIVIDASNYINSEEVPFKAVVVEKYDFEILVKSTSTGRGYDLYYNQILEALEIEDIKKILDLEKLQGDE